MVAPLDLAVLVYDHVVPKVVKAELVVGAICDVAAIGPLLLLGAHAYKAEAHGEPHEVEDTGHHLSLVLRKVLVDGDDVHALARQAVKIRGQGQGEGLALAGLHLGYAALVEYHAALDLHREKPLAQHPVHGLPAGGEGLGEDIVKVLAILKALSEPGGLALEPIVREPPIFLLKPQHLVHQGLDTLEFLFAVVAEKLCKEIICHISFPFFMSR